MSTNETPDASVVEGRRAQRELYGDTLDVRLGAIMRDYGIPQRRLAAVLGLSAPMLSQLISARRVKIGNPLAYERMVTLERRAQEARTGAGETVLEEVTASDITTTTQQRIHGETRESETPSLARQVRDHVGTSELAAACAALRDVPGVAVLAALLDEALDGEAR
ncbi:DNA-binding protein [Microbacterium sp.]|uniref:DNA-binding protein n=1 Tax=Microbacterium sp. TaxID=51671 RepID=UPI0039E5424D